MQRSSKNNPAAIVVKVGKFGTDLFVVRNVTFAISIYNDVPFVMWS